MSKYNEQHATTMLNALIGTDTLAEHDKQIRANAIDDYVKILVTEFNFVDTDIQRFIEIGESIK